MEDARRGSSLESRCGSSAESLNPSSKRGLRSGVLSKRRALEAGVAASNSRTVEAILGESGLVRDASAVLAYVSAKDNEVDTHGIIRGLLAAGGQVFVPVTDFGTRGMQWSHLLAMEELERTRFGLLEPAAKARRIEPIPNGAVCLVPGLAFTRDGWRIGYGGGYFDRFLDVFCGIAVGLAHDAQVVDHIPTEDHDRPVDYLVTELGVTDCRKLRRLATTGG